MCQKDDAGQQSKPDDVNNTSTDDEQDIDIGTLNETDEQKRGLVLAYVLTSVSSLASR